MNASTHFLLPEVLLGPQPADQPALELATEGVQRYVWQSAFGPILIEVRDGVAYVNAKRVMPMHEFRPEAQRSASGQPTSDSRPSPAP